MICSQSTTHSQVEGFNNNGNFDMDGRIKSRIHKVTVIGALSLFCFLPHENIDVAAIVTFQNGTRRVCYKVLAQEYSQYSYSIFYNLRTRNERER